MYHHLKGQLRELSPTSAVVEVGGIGFELRIPLSTHDRLKGKTDVSLFTHLHVREDDLRLFGFATGAERNLFRLLISVTGVGPSIALAALCSLSPEEVAQAVAAEDVKVLQEIKGVGRKLGERLVIELRDRIRPFLGPGVVRREAAGRPAEGRECLGTQEASDAVLALLGLGFEKKSAETKVIEKYRALASQERTVDAESLIKEVLRGR